MIEQQAGQQQAPAAQQQPAQPQQATEQRPEESAIAGVEASFVDEGEASLGPAQEAQLEAYTDNATIAVWSEKSQPTVLQLLQSEETPAQSIGMAAFQLHKQLEQGLRQTGEKPTEITLCLGAAHLVSELVALAEVAELYTTTNEERAEAFRYAVQKYFEEGIAIFTHDGPDAQGAIDPVKLQQAVEPLMTQEQRSEGMRLAQENGLSRTAPASGTMGMETRLQAPQQQSQEQQQPPQGLLGGAMQ